MSKEEELPKALTAKKSEFSSWYNQILQVAGIIDKRYDVKAMFIWLDYGYSIMLNIKKEWDNLFKESGIKELYFPLIVPTSYCEQNSEWWEGFKNQAFLAKGSGDQKAEYILRPTGEPAMYPMFKKWIRTYTDLPLRIYETVFSYRYETKHTSPLIRDREIGPWYEIHTAHATKEEADKEIEEAMRINDIIWEKLAIQPLKVIKPIWECFPGAVGAVEYYNIMPNGRALENGSCNNLGQAYAKKFDIKFKDGKGEEDYVWMTCTGNGERYLAAAIAAHGDDKGLIIPPAIAPIEAVIIPIYKQKDKDIVIKYSNKVYEELKKSNIKVKIDLDEDTPGSKYYKWELKGIPIRIEIGPKETKEKSVTLVRRDNFNKTKSKEKDTAKRIESLLKDIQQSLYDKSKKEFKVKIIPVKSSKEIKEVIESKKIAKVFWCGNDKCWDKIKALKEGIELFGTDIKKSKGQCIVCNQSANDVGYVANTY